MAGNRHGLSCAQSFGSECHQLSRPCATGGGTTYPCQHRLRVAVHRNGALRSGAHLRAAQFEMKPSPRITVIASLLLVFCLGGSALLMRKIDRIRTGATLEEVLYVPSPKVLKRLSLGYDGLLADVYWTRAVQYFGKKHSEGAMKYALLAPLLEITTTLDPHLVVAYEFGTNF